MSKKSDAKKKGKNAKKSLDNVASAPVNSSTSTVAQATPSTAASDAAEKRDPVMPSISLTKDTKQRKSNAVAYTAAGYAGSVRFSKSFFADKSGPSSMTLSDESFGAARVAKAKLTAEERKALRASQPKLTPAEKLAKIEERAAKLRAKIAAASTEAAQ